MEMAFKIQWPSVLLQLADAACSAATVSLNSSTAMPSCKLLSIPRTSASQPWMPSFLCLKTQAPFLSQRVSVQSSSSWERCSSRLRTQHAATWSLWIGLSWMRSSTRHCRLLLLCSWSATSYPRCSWGCSASRRTRSYSASSLMWRYRGGTRTAQTANTGPRS